MLQAGAFSPLSLNPALWLSDTGSNTAQWDDLSGNGRHATQATGVSQPAIVTNALNGRQVRRFDGSNDFYDLTSVAADIFRNRDYGSIFAICRTTAPAAAVDHMVFHAARNGSDTQARLSLFANTAGARNFTAAARRLDADAVTTAARANNGSYNILNAEADFANGLLRIGQNNAYTQSSLPSSGNTSDTASNVIFIGRIGAAYISGDIAEILIFNAPITTDQRSQVNRYASAKYNIALA
jgi:hypothetical protein